MIKVDFTNEAKRELNRLPPEIKMRMIDVIRAKAPYSHEQPLMLDWTFCADLPITRIMKDYAYSPGWRILIHHEGNWNHIVVDRICRRDCEPYRAK